MTKSYLTKHKSVRKNRRKSVRKNRRKSVRKNSRKSIRKNRRKSIRKNRRKNVHKGGRKSVKNNKLSIKQLGGFENKILTQPDIIKYGTSEGIVKQFRTLVINDSNDGGAKTHCANLKEFNDMIIHMFGRLRDLIRGERQPTLVSIGNSPYKIVRLLELFSGVKDLQSIYIPFSGKYKSIAPPTCSCGTVRWYKDDLAKETPAAINARDKGIPFPPDRNVEDIKWGEKQWKLIPTNVDGKVVNLMHWNVSGKCNLAKGQSELEDIIFEPDDLVDLYRKEPDIHRKQYTLRQLGVFTKIITESGLVKAVSEGRQIIFVDYIETGLGLASFLITFEKILNDLGIPVNPIQIKIYGLCRSEKSEPAWARDSRFQDELQRLFTRPGRISPSGGLMLGKYHIEYIPLEHIDINECANIFLNIDSLSNDRCVKSYEKDKWEHNSPYPFKTSELTKCNITLSYMYHILKARGLIH